MTDRKIIARFAERRRWDTPLKNFQTCNLVYEGGEFPERQTALASVNRTRKTKRSVWTLEVRLMASTSWMSPADFRAYFNALADAAESVEWPSEEIVP